MGLSIFVNDRTCAERGPSLTPESEVREIVKSIETEVEQSGKVLEGVGNGLEMVF